MRKLILSIALAALLALPATVLCRNAIRTASPAGVGLSESAGKVLRSAVGGGIESRTLSAGGELARSSESLGREAETFEGATGLLPCYPNPFNPTTTVAYRPAGDTHVELAVYDVSGRFVRLLASHHSEAGSLHEVVWDGKGNAGERLPSGVYLLRLLTETSEETRKLVLLK
jgi:hypothetical protein